MRIAVLIGLFLLTSITAFADHITGGEMYYTYIGYINGHNQYSVTLKLYMRCNSGRQFPDPAIISVFDKKDNSRVEDIGVERMDQRLIRITNPDPCITNPPQVCYEVAYYTFTVALRINQHGYILASQVNYRINGISNLDGTQVGATYTCEIPGSQPQGDGHVNNSAVFTGSDLVIVCAGNYFSYSFAAKDPDGDVLRYSFCAAYRSSFSGVNGIPAGDPPYNPVPYNFPGFMETLPLGKKVSVDATTGLITGVAPPQGVYVVTVCVDEIRNGTVIATQRKDLQINVADCSVAGALLEDDYMVCGDTRTTSIANLSASPLIVSYDWAVFNPSGTEIFASQNNSLNYTFPSNGVYTVQVVVNKGHTCTDTSSAPVYVFPGLKPDFDATGICISKPTLFADRTTTQSGTVNSWQWLFDEPTVFTDVSDLRNPAYQYPAQGRKTPRLIVTTTDGCRDTVYKTIDIVDKPPVNLAFRDTLICVNDRIRLQANGSGNFSWTASGTITNAQTATPFVSPVSTTTYYVDMETGGCANKDSVLVRVTDHVDLRVMQDTVVCSGDTIQLKIESNGTRYAWTPAQQLDNALAQNPRAITPATTAYQVTAFIGSCTAVKNLLVTAVPYPVARAGNDTTICFGTSARLQAFTDGTSWAWFPGPGLSNTTLLNPSVSPASSFAYIFSATGNKGCPRPSYDTVQVTVLPEIVPFAGKDTAVVMGQPLQLNASGGDSYQWSPPHSLSDAAIANPVAVFNEPSAGFTYKVRIANSAGCYDSASVVIKVYSTPPTVFVPTAFSPNNDGINDVLRPIVAGMQRLDYFQVYNRWGQLVFSTSVDGHGWDGRINGQSQPNSVYVWVVKATDYNGSPYMSKGTVILVR